jgi:hypothetical protein
MRRINNGEVGVNLEHIVCANENIMKFISLKLFP